MSRVEVSIMGQSLVLSSPDGEEEALREAAQRVDNAMCRIRDAGKVKARERIAILASLNLVFEMMNAKASAGTEPMAAADTPVGPIDEAALKELLARLDDALHEDDSLI
jgi:cell division protein ZapA